MLKKIMLTAGLLTMVSTPVFADGPIQCAAQCAQNLMACVINCGGNFVCTAGCADTANSCMLNCFLNGTQKAGDSCQLAIHSEQAQVKETRDVEQLRALLQQSQNNILKSCLPQNK